MDACVSNPPYNLKWNIPPLASFMPKYQGFPIPKNANYAFVLSGFHLSGRSVFILPKSVLTPSGEDKEILQKLIENVAGVVLCPERMFESTSIAVCLLILERNRKTRRIALVDLTEAATEETREQRGQYGGASHTNRVYKKGVNVFSRETIEKTVKAVNELVEAPNVAIVTPEIVAEHDFNLTPSLYLNRAVEITHRSFEDIAADYNRIVDAKNEISITMNETAAKRLGFSLLGQEVDVSASFAAGGQVAKKAKFFTTTKSDGIVIRCSTKDGIPLLIQDFLYAYSQRVRFLNEDENRILAEYRDALLPKLMSGEIDYEEDA